MSTTSIGPQPDQGGNESHGNADGMGNKTLGEQGTQDPPAGADVAPGDSAEAVPKTPATGAGVANPAETGR